MTKEQLELLLKYIDALIEYRLTDSLNAHENGYHGEWGNHCYDLRDAKDEIKAELFALLGD